MNRAAGVVYGSLLAALLLGCQSSALDRQFGNMTYLTTSANVDERVTLVDGEYHWTHKTPDVFLSYALTYNGRFLYGDFNRDGLKDAAVIITENEGGSGDFRSLAFLINDGERLVHRASHYLGDRAIVNSLTERRGKVVLDMLVHRDGDCMAGPTKRVKNSYDYLNPNPSVIPQSQAGAS